MKLKIAFQLAPWAALLAIAIFWCPLHQLMPCGNGGFDGTTAPVSVTQTVTFDSTKQQLPQVQTAPTETRQQWRFVVNDLQKKNDRLQKQHRSDSLSLVLVSIQKQNTDQQNRLLRQFAERLTKADTAAIVHRWLFEKKTAFRTFRKDSVAEVTVTTTMYQNDIEAQTADFKNLAQTTINNNTSHYRERFQVYAGGAVSVLTDKDFNSSRPFGGLAIDMKFPTGTNLSPMAQVGANADVLFTLKVTQLIRIPVARAWIEQRKIRRAQNKINQ